MKITLVAAAAALIVAAVPAFAAEDYQVSPAFTFGDHVIASDTGSTQAPHFDGLASTPRSEMVYAPSASEAGVESANSQTVSILGAR